MAAATWVLLFRSSIVAALVGAGLIGAIGAVAGLPTT